MFWPTVSRLLLLLALVSFCAALPQGTGPDAPVCTGATRASQIAKIEAIANSRGYSACSSTLGLYATSTRTTTIFTARTTATNVKVITATAPVSTQVSLQEFDVTDVSTQLETTQVTVLGPLSELVVFGVTHIITGALSIVTVASDSTTTLTDYTVTLTVTAPTTATVTNGILSGSANKRDVEPELEQRAASPVNLGKVLGVGPARVSSVCSCIATGPASTSTVTTSIKAIKTIIQNIKQATTVIPAVVLQTSTSISHVTSVTTSTETQTSTSTVFFATTTLTVGVQTITPTATVTTTPTSTVSVQYQRTAIACTNKGIYTGQAGPHNGGYTLTSTFHAPDWAGSICPIPGRDVAGGIQACANDCATRGCNQFFAFSTYNGGHQQTFAGQVRCSGYLYETRCFMNYIDFTAEDCSSNTYLGDTVFDAAGYVLSQ